MGEVDEIGALARILEPTRTDVETATQVANEVDDVYVAQLTFANGAIGSAVAGWSGHGERSGLEASPIIYGTAGCIKGDAVISDAGPLGSAEELFATMASGDVKARFFPGGLEDAFGLEILDFLTAIKTGTEMEASATEGVLDLAMAYAVLESSAAETPVRVQDVLSGDVAAYQADIDAYYDL
jgi:predicted dehydrogenase